MSVRLAFVLIAFFLSTSCTKTSSEASANGPDAPKESAAPDAEALLLEEAAALVGLMTDGQVAAQVIMTGVDASGPLDKGEKERLRRVPAGAVMLFRKNLDTDALSIRRMTAELCAETGFPLGEAGLRIEPFIAVDHEGGEVHRFTAGVRRLPAPLSYFELAGRDGRDAALLAVESDAAGAAGELAALGITMNLAPLAELLTDGNRSFLGTRSYGPDAGFTTAAAAALMRGMKAAGIACVLKHFPGNAGTDPHEETPVMAGGGEALRQAVTPFAVLVSAVGGPPPSAVMVSHVVVPAWDEARSASLSETVIRQKLRGELGFGGIILADDFSMGAVSGGYGTAEASVASLAAGVDMVMAWPRNLVSVHAAILAALSDGSLPRARLADAASRIVREKMRRAPVSANK
ncbi:MAG: glycoside hydrolase family 3 protein [Spirochaetaceae bacterium]|nr:glycoside hydrolase family 3 protein [Spirochaetaceae bacterium]